LTVRNGMGDKGCFHEEFATFPSVSRPPLHLRRTHTQRTPRPKTLDPRPQTLDPSPKTITLDPSPKTMEPRHVI